MLAAEMHADAKTRREQFYPTVIKQAFGPVKVPAQRPVEPDPREELLKKLAAARRDVEYLQRTLKALGLQVETAIEDTERNEHVRPTVDAIQRKVCQYYGISKEDLLAQRRTTFTVRIRHIAMYLCKDLTLRSLPDLGRRFGGMDHTSVLHGARKITKELPLDAGLAFEVAELTNIIGGQQ
jgi:chromosomal replication initiator protein